MLIAVLLAILLYCMMCASGIRCAGQGRLQRVREFVVDFGTCWASIPPQILFIFEDFSRSSFTTITHVICAHFSISSFSMAGPQRGRASGSVCFGLLLGRTPVWVEHTPPFSTQRSVLFIWVGAARAEQCKRSFGRRQMAELGGGVAELRERSSASGAAASGARWRS